MLSPVLSANSLDNDVNVFDSFFLTCVFEKGALVFFMQAGFAMLCAGSVRKKNTQNTMLKNLLDACGAAIAYFFFGYAIAFGDSGDNSTKTTTFVGKTNFVGTGDIDLSFFFFQYTFTAAAVTIVAGALAERCQMAAYLCYSVVLTGFVYPVIVHAVWSSTGFLSTGNADPLLNIGMVDFAGSGVVRTSCFGCIILGPRRCLVSLDASISSALNTMSHLVNHPTPLRPLIFLIFVHY